ncbi:MAG: hypothetical protein H6729_14320 [Deltaproteobacteria bacterium]|nr:hypothetical protein [Deltaproteobacteria bacterium]
MSSHLGSSVGVILSFGLSVVAASGCGLSSGDADDLGAAYDESVAASVESRLSQAPVRLIDSGHYGAYVYHGITRESFWVDLSVEGGASSKEVGIVWTADDWATSKRVLASYEGALPNGREQWGVDVRDFYTGYGPVEVRFAAFATLDHVTSWSPFRNHTIYQPVSPERPLRRLDSALHLDANGEASLEVKARALNVEGAIVWARVTTDGWATWRDAMGQRDGEEWVVRCPVEGDAIETVDFALAFEADGKTFWDNNDRKNFVHRVLPIITDAGFGDIASIAASGIRLYRAHAASDLPITGVRVYVDGQLWKTLEPLEVGSGYDSPGFFERGDIRVVLPLTDLSDGGHTLSLDVSVGDRSRHFDPVSFLVASDLFREESWATNVANDSTPWDIEVAPDGAVYLMRDYLVEKYDAFGDPEPSVVFELPPVNHTGRRITVDPEGRVYGIYPGQDLVRWLSDGTLDSSFGTGGLVKLDGAYEGTQICFPTSVAATSARIYVSDSCNSRVLSFDVDGRFVEAVKLGLVGEGLSISGNIVYEAGNLWVVRTAYRWRSRAADEGDAGARARLDAAETFLVRLTDANVSGGGGGSGQATGLTVEEVLEVDADVGAPQDFAVTAAGFWMVDGSSRTLHFVDRTGQRVSTWCGGGRIDLPGALDLPQGVGVLSDGSVAVLSVGTNRVERFASRGL